MADEFRSFVEQVAELKVSNDPRVRRLIFEAEQLLNPMLLEDKKKLCKGCRDDFYNGNNPLGVAECWCFKGAKVVMRKRVPNDLRPPWTMTPGRTLHCKHEDGYVYVGEDIER